MIVRREKGVMFYRLAGGGLLVWFPIVFLFMPAFSWGYEITVWSVPWKAYIFMVAEMVFWGDVDSFTVMDHESLCIRSFMTFCALLKNNVWILHVYMS